ncbi:nickel-responsive transcriptional regulator NikR [uncultured Draconibacterium sp.]|uniref:nickel-responsive transcriptional regulator NikR n=1 Tax=uncultured Draconibacterium sp. TaxID=1573823 RepID=UPI002AA66E25|nr:nickel-responsive transcriptional regulator NikR [uncultured Draconibacterium sp.]
MAVSRFGVSLDEELLEALDKYVEENAFANRSRAIRHLIEKNLVEEKWKCDNIVAGAVIIVFNHGKKDILRKSAEIQYKQKDFILSTQGFHLNDKNYMEIIAVKGPSRKLTEISDQLISMKGIQHGKLVMSKAE